jgi:hypothetical protein
MLKLMHLKQTVRTKISENWTEESLTLRRVTSLRSNIIKEEKSDLVADSHSNLARRRNIFLSYWMYMGILMSGRLKYIQHNYWCLSSVLVNLRWLLKSLKGTNHHIVTKFQQKWLMQEVGQSALISINHILFGVKRDCLSNGRSLSLHLLIRRLTKKITVIIKAYHFVTYVQNST